MKVITKANYLEHRKDMFVYEKNCGKDNVDRSDYVSPEEQYYRLVLAGIQLKRSREYMYDFDDKLTDFKYSKTAEPFMDKIDAIEKYRSALKQYNHVQKQNDRIKKLYSKYLEEMSIIEKENEIKKVIEPQTTQVLKKE